MYIMVSCSIGSLPEKKACLKTAVLYAIMKEIDTFYDIFFNHKGMSFKL